MKIRNVLVFPAGTEIGLEIYQALSQCKEINIFGAGQDVQNHAQYVYSEYHILPSIYEKDWLQNLVVLCRKLSIDYIFPAYDDVIVALSRARDLIPATVIAPIEIACEITRSKSRTYAALEDVIRVPHVYKTVSDVADYPVFVKPDQGQGSSGIKKINNEPELYSSIKDNPNAIICEFLPGEEYTIDCFSDRERGLLYASARIRTRVRNGIAVNTQTVDLPEASTYAHKISTRLQLYGAWFFQLKRAANGELALLEVAPRIAGSMAAHRVLGVNFPLLSIYEHERIPIHIHTNRGKIKLDRALTNRYKHNIDFDILYIDLDDTLIVHDKVNIDAVGLIYWCVNEGKGVVLITRHSNNLRETLEKYKISSLFDEIVHIDVNQKKFEFINRVGAIFVDDSFSERMEVASRCDIPTFDTSMIELITRGRHEKNIDD